MSLNHRFYVIDAAGGNATIIQVLNKALDSHAYAFQGAALMKEYEGYGVEQCGFLILQNRHFQMSGGEFCGNAARAAAQLFASALNLTSFTFTMSGYKGDVEADVDLTSSTTADVTCVFTDLPSEVEPVMLTQGPARLVDLGGIVHVLIEGALPKDYEAQHRDITTQLGLSDRGAVGVNWMRQGEDGVTIDPVVWVRDIDSFFYETACGSGSIAAAAATGAQAITQPSGQTIDVQFDGNRTTLHSPMEIIFTSKDSS